jgi:hypothetical protein
MAQALESLTTQELLEASAGRPLHLLPSKALIGIPVSSFSNWDDDRWVLDNFTKGSSRYMSTVVWNLALPDVTNLVDPINHDLLYWLKRTIWSAFSAPGDGAGVLKPGTLGGKSMGMRWGVSWLVANHVRWPHQITHTVVRQLIRDLSAEAEDTGEGEERSLSDAVVWKRLNFFSMIWQQRFALRRAGIDPMPQHPFGNKGAYAAGKLIRAASTGQYKPLPDEVAVPLLNQAFYFLETPASDLLKLQEACIDAYEIVPAQKLEQGRGWSRSARLTRQRVTATNFTFSTADSERNPWHPSLLKYSAQNKKIGPLQRLRQLILAVKTAACITIQATTGMRISEICGLRAGINSDTQLPVDVSLDVSLSGLEEIFVLKSHLSKTEETPRAVFWTLGSRPRGAEFLPPAVKAILILNKLLAPYRNLIESKDLLVNFSNCRNGLPRSPTSVGRITTDRLREYYKDFCENWIDLTNLPNESSRKVSDNDLVAYRQSSGRIITTHQFRKLFANFTLRVDSGLISALQMHFHHVSQAMTDGGYRMSEPALLREIDDIKKQQAARTMFELLQDPDEHLAGHRGEIVENQVREAFAERQKTLSTRDLFIEVYSWVDEKELHWYYEPHAICGAISASEMACHKEAGTENIARWRTQLQPNYAVRNPTMCAGCKSVIVMKQHLPFWENRYIETMAGVLHFEATQRQVNSYTRPLELERNRAFQARALCRKHGADLDKLENAVKKRLEELTHG